MATLKRWVLRRRPVGEIQPGDLELVEEPIRDLADGEVLVRTLYLSLDPTNRIWMSDQDQYMPPVQIGDTMRGGSLGVVERSRSDRFKQGDVVNTGLGGWSTHVVANGAMLMPAPQLPGVPLTASLWGAVAGYGSLWAVYWVFKLATGKEGMGYGDFKLLAALGAWLSWQAILPIVLMASVIGAVVGLLPVVILTMSIERCWMLATDAW